jgi:putative ABC transport system permease protein
MIKSYLKIAWTDLVKNKYFSLLNITGLALGISLCMVIITIIKNQLDYDHFHPYPGKTYRINTEAERKNGNSENYATSPLPLGKFLKENYSFVQAAVSLTGGLSGDASINEKTIFINGFFSGEAFLNVFGYRLLYGNPQAALDNPNDLVLSYAAAEKLFGKNINPVGQVLSIKGLDEFRITGVFKEPAGKTHLEFDAIGSDKALGKMEVNNKIFKVNGDWSNYYSTYTYVLLKSNSDKGTFTKALDETSKKQYPNQSLQGDERGYKFYSQAIDKIAAGPILSNNMGKALPENLLWYLGVLGFAVIVSAGFNYNSLSLSRALTRSKEIGIRKATGARKHQLIIQFLVQSVVTALVAMIIAAALFHFLLRPFFENIGIFKSAGIILYEDAALYMLFTIFSILVGIIAGIFPSLYLASLNPLKALKENNGFAFSPKLGFRKVLLIIQFALAIVFVTGLINIYRQVNYVMNADYGFQTKNVINVDLQGNNYTTMRQVFSQVSGVAGISGSSHSIGTTKDRAVDVRLDESSDKFRMRDFTIDESYLDNFKLRLVAGQNFKKDIPVKNESSILVNESFIKFFNLSGYTGSIGKRIILGDSETVTIMGVIKDFNFQPLTKVILPVIFRYNIADIMQLNITLDKADAGGTLIKLSKAWKSIDPENGFKYSFITDELQQAYSQYKSLPELLTIITMISVIVAGLGLLGLATFSLKQRIKEISIRKIMGATIAEISFLLSKSFIQLISTGLIIGMPLAIYMNMLFVKNFAYRVNSILGYILAIALLFVIVFLTIGIQIIRMARTNPVKSLRTE